MESNASRMNESKHSKQMSHQLAVSIDSSNVVPSGCEETTEMSSASAINMLTKMTTMRAVLIRQKSIYNTSTDGKMQMSDCSSQVDLASPTNDFGQQLEQKARLSLKGQMNSGNTPMKAENGH